MIIKKISINDFHSIEKLLNTNKSFFDDFTYFQTRNKEVINDHIVTLLGFINEVPVAYGHLDYDKDLIWLGIAISKDYRKLGLGKKMMQELINESHVNNLNRIFLSVKNDNFIAKKLYKSFNFKLYKESSDSEYYYLDINK